MKKKTVKVHDDYTSLFFFIVDDYKINYIRKQSIYV